MRLTLYICLLLTLTRCTPPAETTAEEAPPYPTRITTLAPAAAASLATKLRAETNVSLAEGLTLDLWASDSLVQDPIAISVAPDGRVFFTSATRQGNSEFDVRGHRDWINASMAFETVEDRSKFLRETFTADSDQSVRSLQDLNHDGVRDWRDLTVAKEQVWFVTDQSGDDVADRAQLYLEDFHEEHTDVANGIEFADGEVYISVGPDLWKTGDTDGDSIADRTESLSHGYIVHIGFSGHGMSGVTVGPQGRIWWGQGDVGMNVVDKTGKRHKYPNEGTIVRCNPDGTNFEVFAHGLRNTHEFAFDDYGNLITVDNDGDHAGERERLVYLIDGSDSGWRINWQFGKYTDPANNDYKVWMDERLHVPRWEGQAAYILPPIENYVNGPTGLVYNPGTALSPEYYQHFFVAEFRGSPGNSPLHAFTMEPEGAGFRMGSTKEVINGLLPTGLDFAPDGSLLVADWVNGWGVKEEGRIWKMDIAGGASAGAVRTEVQRLLRVDYNQVSLDSLRLLLGHQDQRIRRNAQFELAGREAKGLEVLLGTARDRQAPQLSRIHGIWGIAQMARRAGDAELAAPLADLLRDGDPEIIAQAARMLGDLRYDAANDHLIDLVGHDNPRVSFMATEALGRTQARAAVGPILEMLERNDGQDTYLRAGGMIALGRIGDAKSLAALTDHPSRALRTAAVVALRRMESPRIADFLSDEDEYIVAEAARGINDDYSIDEALPALAAVLEQDRFTSEALLRRAINANLRVGKRADVQRLVDYAARPGAPDAMRAEALATLASWGSPSIYDRVDGRHRGRLDRDSTMAAEVLAADIDGLITRGPAEVRALAMHAAGRLRLTQTTELLNRQLTSASTPYLRTAALNALVLLDDPALDEKLELALADRDGSVRARALEILPRSAIDPDRSVALYERVLAEGTTEEQQSALTGLAGTPGEASSRLLGQLIDGLRTGGLPAPVRLDLVEAVEQHGDTALNALLLNYESELDDDLGLYALALEGGNPERGEHLFYRNEAAQCVRCHVVFEYGGNVGPALTDIGNDLNKRQLLEALVAPSARLAPGYETVLVTLADGEVLSGIVERRTDDELTLRIGQEAERTLASTDIAEAETLPSSMPSMAERLSRREIRDLVAYLGELQGHDS